MDSRLPTVDLVNFKILSNKLQSFKLNLMLIKQMDPTAMLLGELLDRTKTLILMRRMIILMICPM